MMRDAPALWLLLSLVDPVQAIQHKQEAGISSAVLKSAMRLAKANGLLYPLVGRLEELGQAPQFVRQARLREERKREAYLRTLYLLNRIDAELGLKYTLIKACTFILHVPRDIDVFVRPSEKPRFARALRESGMKCAYDSPAESSYAGAGHMELDIYTTITYANKTFFDEDHLWQSRAVESVSGVQCWGLQPQANYALILIHSLFGHRVLSLLDFLQLRSLKNKMDMTASREYAFNMGWGEVFDIAVEKLDEIDKKLFSNGRDVSFPLLFDRDFVLRCFAMLQGRGAPDYRPSASLKLSLVIDGLVHRLRKSSLYEPLERLRFPGKIATSLGLIVRRLRGDRKG